MKPVELIRRMLRNSTTKNDVAVEPFTGSGSTLVACVSQYRVFRGTVLAPGFVDVACARYQATTGKLPTLERTGNPVDMDGH